MKKLKKIIRFFNKPFFRNRYFLTFLAFSVWMLFFDQHDIISQAKLRSELYKLQDDKQYYKEEISRTKSDLDDLLTNPDRLEKFAREKYLMKRENEDVFVIVKEGNDSKGK